MSKLHIKNNQTPAKMLRCFHAILVTLRHDLRVFIKIVLKKKNYHMNVHEWRFLLPCSVMANKSVQMEQNNKHTYATATSLHVFLNHMHNAADVRKDRT